MKIRVTMDIDLDQTFGKKIAPGKQSSTLGFSLRNTIFRVQMPEGTHKDVLGDFGVSVVSIEPLKEGT